MPAPEARNTERPRSLFNGNVAQRVLTYGLCLAVGGAWAFLTSRASEEDMEKLEKHHKEDVEQVKKSLKILETNGVKVCQFLDRQDKQAGGPGLDCKDPG